MAKVEAMNFGMLQAKGVSSAAGNKNVSSTEKSTVFEQIFSGKNVSQKDSVGGEQEATSQTEFSPGKAKEFSKKEDFVAEATGILQNQEGDGMKSELPVVEGEMKQIVKDILGIDDATLEQTMTALGVVITDLLNPNVLQEFVLQVAGGEGNIDFLTNEALLQNFNNLLQALTDFMSENGKEVMMLMEVLEQPVPFEEMLETTVAEENTLSQEISVTEMTSENVQTASQWAGKSQTEQPSDNVSKMVEKVTVEKTEAVQEVTETPIEQSFSGESQSGQFSEEMPGQGSATLLYADRSDAPAVSEMGNTLFAEQMNVVQGNIEQIVDVNGNGLQRMQQMVDIVNQVSEQIRSTVDASTTTMEMQLNPESLGKVLLTVSAKEGVMTATFKVQSEEARQALESQMYQLRENLEAKNLKVESVDVQISNFSFSQSNEADGQTEKDFGKQGKKKFNFDVAEEEEDMEVSQETPEQTRRRVMLESGGSIDYTA